MEKTTPGSGIRSRSHVKHLLERPYLEGSRGVWISWSVGNVRGRDSRFLFALPPPIALPVGERIQ